MMKAMILAAGLGTRLLPFTLKRAKPLFPVLNKPLLNLTISRIRNSGFSEIIVNAHHLRKQIRKALQYETNCILQEEEKILGTGGGLRMALPHFNHEPVLIVNGDIYHTVDYQEVYRSHCDSKADVTLVLHDYPRFNDVGVDEKSMITGFNSSNKGTEDLPPPLAFTGIHVINPDVLGIIPFDTPYCIIECYKNLLKQGGSIRAYLATDHFWTDMGTPEDYLKLNADLLERKIPVYGELDEVLAEAPFVGTQKASIAEGVKLLDWACIGKGAAIKAGTTLQRAIVWDGAVVPAGSIIKDTIITP
jgi:mannose-1-phosphate guanylyltransferase